VPSPQTNYITIKRRLLSPLSLLFVLTRSGRMEINMKNKQYPFYIPLTKLPFIAIIQINNRIAPD
jgi:hypothetical protein